MIALQNSLVSAQFVRFTYLQALDLLSTAAFLRFGVEEANPMVRWSMSVAPNPFGGLLLVKAFALCLAVVCLVTGRQRLVSRMNKFFGLLVIWNLFCLILAS